MLNLFKISLIGFLLTSIISCEKHDSIQSEQRLDSFQLADMPSSFSWHHASIPATFPEAVLINDKQAGFNRAKIAHFAVDPMFYREGGLSPSYIKSSDLKNYYLARVLSTALFPYEYNSTVELKFLSTQLLTFYPNQRGVYNFETSGSEYSAGINQDGELIDPESRWGGVTCGLTHTELPVTHIEFWLMDPFLADANISGTLNFNIGIISEDVLKEGQNSCANSLSSQAELNIKSDWGMYGPDNCHGYCDRCQTHVPGLDGLYDDDEQVFFSDFIDKTYQICSDEAFQQILNDPASDNFQYYLGSIHETNKHGILERYKDINGFNFEGELNPDLYIGRIYLTEDVNNDDILNLENNYYEYSISCRKEDFAIGQNYIDSVRITPVSLLDGSIDSVNFYHFSIPFEAFTREIGTPNPKGDFKFFRIYLTGFNREVIFRFVRLKVYYDKMVAVEYYNSGDYN